MTRKVPTETHFMKYMLMMNTPGAGPYRVTSWPRHDLQAHMDFMRDFVSRLAASGELVAAEGLAGPDQAKLVRGGKDGEPVTDGVFPETKEFLAGFWIIEVATTERAYALAAEASMAPGPGGAPMHLGIEVRQVMSAPPRELP